MWFVLSFLMLVVAACEKSLPLEQPRRIQLSQSEPRFLPYGVPNSPRPGHFSWSRAVQSYQAWAAAAGHKDQCWNSARHT